jgi:glycosyltransferase involved in cell wall biosynthesis
MKTKVIRTRRLNCYTAYRRYFCCKLQKSWSTGRTSLAYLDRRKPLNWLFVHQTFPAQYAQIARFLANEGHNVVAISRLSGNPIAGIKNLQYRSPRTSIRLSHYVQDFVSGVRNGFAVAAVGQELKRGNFDPDLIIGHAGWGELLFLKEVWPNRPLLGYFEFYFRHNGGPAGFDAEFPCRADDPAYFRTRNAIQLTSFEVVERGQTPTEFQRSTYPQRYRKDITVLHEGVDTEAVRPDAATRVWLGNRLFVPGDEIVTYSARSLEPHRGFHIFMRALPLILRRHPRAHALIVGGRDTSYSAPPAKHRSYAEQLVAEIKNSVDRRRVHFVGFLSTEHFRAVLQISAVHVYFTYPFVLSWSLIEALSAGCLVVGSRTAPVQEVISDGETGLLVDFFDYEGLADRVCYGLTHGCSKLRVAARETAVKRFDFNTVCLPAHLRLLQRLTGSRTLAAHG